MRFQANIVKIAIQVSELLKFTPIREPMFRGLNFWALFGAILL